MGSQTSDLLKIQDDRRNGVARLALRGELDMGTAPDLEEHLKNVETDGVRAVLLDVRDLTFVDSCGLRTFLRAHSRAADNGHRFAVVGPNDQLRKLVEMTATQPVLDEHEGLALLGRFTQNRSDPAPALTSGQTQDPE